MTQAKNEFQKPASRKSSARYRPREYLAPGIRFGGSKGVGLKGAIGYVEIARANASRLQSDMSFEIRKRMDEESVQMATLARAMITSYDHLGKLLRGQVIMTFEDRELAMTILDGYRDSRERKERRPVIEQRNNAR
jgi:hypothetical protein